MPSRRKASLGNTAALLPRHLLPQLRNGGDEVAHHVRHRGAKIAVPLQAEVAHVAAQRGGRHARLARDLLDAVGRDEDRVAQHELGQLALRGRARLEEAAHGAAEGRGGEAAIRFGIPAAGDLA